MSMSAVVIAVVVSTCAPTRTVHMFAPAIPAMGFLGTDSAAQVCEIGKYMTLYYKVE
jgi:hypothetical protein